MKKLIAIFVLVFGLSACSLDDDNTPNYQFYTEVLPITSFELPAEFNMGESYEIIVRYNAPSTCHSFSRIYYEKELNTRIIAVENTVNNTDGVVCEELNQEVETSFEFFVTNNGSYVFKFWSGVNEYGEDEYYEVEVPVVE